MEVSVSIWMLIWTMMMNDVDVVVCYHRHHGHGHAHRYFCLLLLKFFVHAPFVSVFFLIEWQIYLTFFPNDKIILNEWNQ